jgi:hypothetical protein
VSALVTSRTNGRDADPPDTVNEPSRRYEGSGPRNPICVLSAGRSGTSLAAQAIHRLGVYLGTDEDLIPASAHNESGFWEHASIYRLNEELLASLGASWYRPRRLPPGWSYDARYDGIRARASELVTALAAPGLRWGFKDARTLVTLEFWRRIIGPMDYLICVRNPHAMIESVQRGRDMFPQDPTPQDTADLWLLMSAEALRATVRERRAFVFYEDWFADHEAVARALAAFIRPDAPQDASSWKPAAACFDPALRHSDDRATSDAPFAAELDAMHSHLRAAAASSDDVDDRERQVAVADAIVDRFRAAQGLPGNSSEAPT